MEAPRTVSVVAKRSQPSARVTQVAVGIAVSAGFAWVAVRGVHYGQVTGALSHVHWRWLVPATALLLVSIAMRAVRWSVLFPRRHRPAPSACFWALNIGYLANALLPFRAGELIRVLALSRETGCPAAQGLVTILLERVFDLVTIAVLLLAIAPLVPAGVTRTSLVVLSAGVLVLATGMTAVVRSARLRRSLSRWIDHVGLLRRRRAVLESASEAFEPLRSARAAGVVLAWSFASWIVLALSTAMVERAFVRGLPWPSGGLALVATTYAQAIPSSAASVGVFEAAARQSLTVFGVASAVALAFAIAYHAVSVLPMLPLGVVGLGRMGVRSLRPAAKRPVRAAYGEGDLEVSVVIPCLDEERTIGASVDSAMSGLVLAGAPGEVIVVDNGSRDRSVEIARSRGARVIAEPRRGYGSAYLAGLHAAHGRYILMGDGDGTYDFTALPEFFELARGGAGLVMGSRVRGTILPGAMPWHHRWIGNPILTGLLNLLFHTGVSDAHCGLRMVARDTLPQLDLRTPGMEFASEMVIRAQRAGVPMAELPIVYAARPQGSHSKLHSLRDGLRHVRYILAWASGTALAAPVAAVGLLGVVVLLLPGATPRDATAGVLLLTVTGVAVQAAVSLMVWRWMMLEGAARDWLRRVLDRRVVVALASATLIASFLAASALAHMADTRSHHGGAASADSSHRRSDRL
ncbi:MAG: flippase-like domain-containing protein [Gaiellales bacterium]